MNTEGSNRMWKMLFSFQRQTGSASSAESFFFLPTEIYFYSRSMRRKCISFSLSSTLSHWIYTHYAVWVHFISVSAFPLPRLGERMTSVLDASLNTKDLYCLTLLIEMHWTMHGLLANLLFVLFLFKKNDKQKCTVTKCQWILYIFYCFLWKILYRKMNVFATITRIYSCSLRSASLLEAWP